MLIKRVIYPISKMQMFRSLSKGMAAAVTDKFLEKPDYEVTNTTEVYEERHYKETVWVRTKMDSMSYKAATSPCFRRLFNYITGENEPNKTIEMTAPVCTRIDPGAGPNCESTFTMAFYVGKEHWADPPKPTNQEVWIEKWPECDVYVRQFGGFADDEKWLAETRILAAAIEKNTDFDKDYHFVCGYDAPFKMFNRRNEVWFMKTKAVENSDNHQSQKAD